MDRVQSLVVVKEKLVITWTMLEKVERQAHNITHTKQPPQWIFHTLRADAECNQQRERRKKRDAAE